MKILVLGAGGVGAAVGAVAQRRDFVERLVLADVSEARARAAAERTGDARFGGIALDASDAAAIAAAARAHEADAILNAVDPRFNPQIFEAAFEAGCTYLDMAMTLSEPHPERPYEETGVKLGDAQLAQHDRWAERGLLALVGIGVEPGLSDVFARYAADELFSELDEVGVRDGANLTVEGYDFAPTFSIWTTIEECLNPPVIWERGRGWFTTEPFSEPEVFDFPEGIGPVECVNVEHEEVLLDPALRRLPARHVQVRAGRGVHRRAAHAAQARPRLEGAGVRARPRGGAAGRRRRRAPRSGHARRPHARQDLRRHLRHRHRRRTAARARPTSTTCSTTSTRCGSGGTRRSCCRPRSTPSSRSSSWRPASGRERACSPRRRSRRGRSWSCSRSTALLTGSRIGRFQTVSTTVTGAEAIEWDLSDLYDGPDDPRLEEDLDEAAAAAPGSPSATGAGSRSSPQPS